MAEPKQWSPKFDEQQIRGVIDQYIRFPDAFDDRDDDIQSLEDHAQYYQIPFARNKKHQDAFVTRMLKQAGAGFMEGFTTLPPEKLGAGSEPQDTWEGISRNLGHLAGFVGYLPGGKTLRKLNMLETYSRVAEGIRGKSVPMLGANYLQRKVGRAISPVLEDLPDWATSGIVPDLAQGAFHLGTASAISSWTHGVDEMFNAAGFGAVAGGAFRGIGNVRGFGKRIQGNQMKPNGSPDMSKLEPGQKLDLMMRTTAGMAMQGLPSTLQGATTEEQIYQYAMGAFFGFKEIPYQTRTSREYLADSIKNKYGPDPELNPKWETLTKEMKKIVKRDFQEQFQYSEDGPSESSYVVFDLIANMNKGKGVDLTQIDELANEYARGYGVDVATGEVYAKSLSQKEIKEYKKQYIEDPRFNQDVQDLDMHIAELQNVPGKLMGKNGYVDQVFPELSVLDRLNRSNEIFKEYQKNLNKSQIPKSKAEVNMINFMEKTYGKSLTEKEKGFWRSWAESLRKQEWVEQIEVADTKVRVLSEQTNKLGNQKNLSSEPFIVESAYKAEFGRVNGGKKDDKKFIRVLDHIIYGTKEHDLARAEMGIRKQMLAELRQNKNYDSYTPEMREELARNRAKSHVKKMNRKVIEKMWEQGYYYFGGKGDNKKMYFIRKHPLLNKSTTKGANKKSKEILTILDRAMKANGVKDFKTKYRNHRKTWLKNNKKLKSAENIYDQMYASNVLYDLTMNGFSTKNSKEILKGLTEVQGAGYIKDPKSFNKRQQIWFNTGLSANPTYVINYMKSRGATDIDKSNPVFNFGIFPDAKVPKGVDLKLKDKATKFPEISDGAIIAREEVIDALNLDKGLPTSGKFNKSFIVSPNDKHGTLLGKYGIQLASPELEAYMRDNKIHMLMPESAIKQQGNRKTGSLELNNGKIEFKGDQYELPIKHFRTIMSELTSEKYLKRQQVPKQMYSVLSAFGYAEIDPAVMKDMYKTLSERAIDGTPEGRQLLREYAKSSKSEAEMNKLAENIEVMPLPEVFNILRDPNQSKLAQKLYQKILKTNHEVTEHLANEGELSREAEMSVKRQNQDYEGTIERIDRLFPDGSIGAYMHKFSRDYRMQSLRNYVVHRLTRPKIDNSATSRMRPYEVGLQLPNKKTAELNTNDKIFFLDEGYRALPIKDEVLFGKRDKMTLGKLFDIKENNYRDPNSGRDFSNFKQQVDDILTATVMRVPMDSISGAHGLTFAGFTGIKGFGSLLHPRTMKALGGADLDGDKAFIFFGGETSGFKKSWRKMYEKSKDEYVKQDKDGDPVEKHNKRELDPFTNKAYNEILAEQDAKLMKEVSHPSTFYSPYWRQYMSEGAYKGRDFLGVAVTRRMAVLGAYNSIRAFGDKKVYEPYVVRRYDEKQQKFVYERHNIIMDKEGYSVPYYGKDSKGNDVLKRILFKPKTRDVDLQRFRELSRAAIALGSDPMDESRIKGELFEGKMLDALFDFKVFYELPLTKRVKGKDVTATQKVEAALESKAVTANAKHFARNLSLHKRFLEVNSALYGRNHLEGRRHTYEEIQHMAKAFDYMPAESKNTFLPMLASKIKEINWSDNLFRHLAKNDHQVIKQMYLQHADRVRDNDWLRETMGRSSIKTEPGKFLTRVMEDKLYTREGRETIANRGYKEFMEYIKDFGKVPYHLRESDFTVASVRKNYLEYQALKAEDFLVNDMSDMASLISISEVGKGVDKKEFQRIHAKVDEIKSKTVYMADKRREMDAALRRMGDIVEGKMVSAGEGLKFTFKEVKNNLAKQIEDARKGFGFDDKASAMNDRIRTDSEIRRFKRTLTRINKKGEEVPDRQRQDLFDMLYIGTYSKGDQKQLKVFENLEKQIGVIQDPEMIRAFEQLKKNSTNTSLIREGINSKEISDANLKKFFKNYEQTIRKTQVELNDAQKEQILRESEDKEPIRSFKDDEGNEIRNEFIDANLIDAEGRKYLDELKPFTGLFSGKVKDAELRRVYDSLTEHLEHYHNLDAINLNGFFRGIFKKDINQANKVDLQQLDRVFHEMRNGTWWRRTMDYMLGKDSNPQIKRAYYWMFPKAIDRDLMRQPAMMEWVADVGPYKDKLGNTFENARTVRPTSVIGTIQQLAHRTQELSMQKYEDEAQKWRDELRPYVSALKDGDVLFEIAVARREWRYVTDKLRAKYKDTSSELTSREMPYRENYDKAMKEYNLLKDKIYTIPTKEGNIQKNGEAVVNAIDNIIKRYNVKTRQWLTGDDFKVADWLLRSVNKKGEVTWEGLDKLRKEFHEYIMKTVQQQKDIPIEELGIDGLRRIVKRIIISQTPKRLRTRKRLNEQIQNLEITKFDETGDLGSDYYFPHMTFNRKLAKKKMQRALQKVLDDKTLSPEEVAKESKKIMYQFKKMTGDFMTRDEMGDNFDTMQDVMIQMANNKESRAKNILTNDLKRVGNQFSRDAHIGGWELTPEAYEAYMRNSINTFYKQAMQLSARTSMYNFNNSFYKKTGDTKLTNSWMNFFKLYTQSAMGYPTHIPEHVMNDPQMKIKGTAYKWLADSQAKKRIDYIAKKMGLNRSELKKFNLDEKTIDELSGVEYSQLQGWGALEAKWQLASLLAHPKSSIANLYGGTVHTWISTGYDNLKKARNFDYLKTNINPRWESMKDVERWLQSKGIIEEFLVHEAGLNPQLKSKKNQEFIKQAIQKIKRDPNYSDESLRQLARKNGITERAFAAASSFMRVPERILRRDSFMAHYIQAKEQFGGAIKDYDSPFLINYAKRGVKGTQFLYSAPFRPLFTNSTLGRVFSRFQLWSWNSVRFRNDVIRRAKIAGFREGTPEYDAFKRLAIADLFMLGMSNLFMYSLFESSLPAPWNWFQDTADYLMGDEKERERAFFGSPLGPVQAITPPSLRLLPPMFKWMVTGDSARLTDYYLWTIPPFGRIIRDVVGPGGIIENPFYTVTKFTGLPLMQTGQLIKQENPEEARRGKLIY